MIPMHIAGLRQPAGGRTSHVGIIGVGLFVADDRRNMAMVNSSNY